MPKRVEKEGIAPNKPLLSCGFARERGEADY
jgi:hypothetical protein